MTPQGPTLAVSAQINDWQEGGVITGDASKPELPSVSDYDGNTYPVIEINGVKWLAANLRTTHYNDGTEIPVVDGGTDAWDALTAPAACITENNADYREKYGLLYNYYAVEKGDLCPKGWKVPSKEELGLLPFNDEKGAYSLMAPDENWSSGYNPTNTTGFSALPAGMSRRQRLDDGRRLLLELDLRRYADLSCILSLSGDVFWYRHALQIRRHVHPLHRRRRCSGTRAGTRTDRDGQGLRRQ